MMEVDNSYSEVANCRHMYELETRLILETVSKQLSLCLFRCFYFELVLYSPTDETPRYNCMLSVV